MMFSDRSEAGRMLAKRLGAYAKRENVIVLGIPRGGVVVACEVAEQLEVPFDVFVLRKLGVPGHEELAFGAIATGGVRFVDRDLIESLSISDHEIAWVTERERAELERRELAYRSGRPPLDVQGKTVIVVDDGIATGASMKAGIKALRQLAPARIVIAVPVAPPSTCERLKSEVAELICLDMPKFFMAVGQFYEDFSQVTDEEVTALLNKQQEQAARKVA
jgi:putative phosphoribosyl transferase